MPISKKQLIRFVRLVASLKEKRYPNCSSFAAELREVDISETINIAYTTKDEGTVFDMVENVLVCFDDYLTKLLSVRQCHPRQKIERLPNCENYVSAVKPSRHQLITWIAKTVRKSNGNCSRINSNPNKWLCDIS